MTETEIAELEARLADIKLSAEEHMYMCIVCDKAPRLEYPMITRTNSAGELRQMYDIPEDGKRAALAACWPFADAMYGYDSTVVDLHSGHRFKFVESEITRFEGRNMIVSPKYLEKGGMLIDMVPEAKVDSTAKNGECMYVETMTLRKKKEEDSRQ